MDFITKFSLGILSIFSGHHMDEDIDFDELDDDDYGVCDMEHGKPDDANTCVGIVDCYYFKRQNTFRFRQNGRFVSRDRQIMIRNSPEGKKLIEEAKIRLREMEEMEIIERDSNDAPSLDDINAFIKDRKDGLVIDCKFINVANSFRFRQNGRFVSKEREIQLRNSKVGRWLLRDAQRRYFQIENNNNASKNGSGNDNLSQNSSPCGKRSIEDSPQNALARYNGGLGNLMISGVSGYEGMSSRLDRGTPQDRRKGKKNIESNEMELSSAKQSRSRSYNGSSDEENCLDSISGLEGMNVLINGVMTECKLYKNALKFKQYGQFVSKYKEGKIRDSPEGKMLLKDAQNRLTQLITVGSPVSMQLFREVNGDDKSNSPSSVASFIEKNDSDSPLGKSRCSSMMSYMSSTSSHRNNKGKNSPEFDNNYIDKNKRPKLDSNIFDPLSLICNLSLDDLSSFDLSTLKKFNLKVPLSFEWFKFFMSLAYIRHGGRDNLENKKGVKALIPDKNGRKTMYGGMSESFVEHQLIRRSRITSDDNFLDVGSGIGQVCIQVAATVGCQCTGMEIISSRHNAGVDLLSTFDSVLSDAGISGIAHLVTLMEADFADRPSVIAQSTVMWFNNFGPWFTSNDPGNKIDYSLVFCQQIQDMKPGSQIFCLNPLIEASAWVRGSTFMSNQLDCSWTDQRLTVYYYVIPEHMEWECKRCSNLNSLYLNQCNNCHAKNRPTRQQVCHSFPTF